MQLPGTGMRHHRGWGPGAAVLLLAALATGCDAAAEAEIQPLPPLSRPSREARLGLPEVAGMWRFAGWELPDSAAAAGASALAVPGNFWIRAQRLDSIGGIYLVRGVRFPVVGEVRRDGHVALVTDVPGAEGRFAAGRLQHDTLWISLTSFTGTETWPAGTRVAWVRSPPRRPFIRLPGGVLLNDTTPPDTLPPPADTTAAADTTGAGAAPDTTRPAAGTPPRPPAQPQQQPRPAPPARPDTGARPREPRPDTGAPPTPPPARAPAPGPAR